MKHKKTHPFSLYGMQIKHSPTAHKLSVALNMASIGVDIPTADAIYRVFEKMSVMGGKFDLETACKIRADIESEYQEIALNYQKQVVQKNKNIRTCKTNQK